MCIRLQYIQQLGLRGLLLSPELSGALVMSSHRLEAVLAGAYRVFSGAEWSVIYGSEKRYVRPVMSGISQLYCVNNIIMCITYLFVMLETGLW